MDELVHHCLRELSFDGDLGSNVSRLKDFILGFYSTHGGLPQVVDDAFCAFVWSVIVEQAAVRVGTVPIGMTSEVYVAPQTSAKRKAAAKGEELVEDAPPTLQLVHDARGKTLEDLKRQHGDGLRIAVDPETSFVAITGSHVRPPKLSPMVYTALQFITRGREEGITTVELGRKTKYDQKTCFYLIKQLVELGLVVKLRRGGVGNHTCIHKYFVERTPFWQHIQEEEARDDEVLISGENTQPPDALDQAASFQVTFNPIDSRHLSSLPLIKNRIVKLLKASRNYMHASNNLLMTIGFMHPTKTDRRFFQTRLRELIQQGVIERVLVPSGKLKDRHVKCIRLVTSDSRLPEGVVLQTQEIDGDEKEVSFDDDMAGHTGVKTNVTINKQVSDLLERAGPSGLTLNEICTSLGNFDKRTIELLLTRASQSRPPSHLSDLGTADVMETFGRERRHRYFAIAAYETVMASEQLQGTTTPHVDVDLSRVGEFAESDCKLFYDDSEQLSTYQDSFKEKVIIKGKKRQRGDVEKQGAASDEENEGGLKTKRGRPSKVATDDVQPLPKKRGRPRKHPLPEDAGDQIATSKRGRPGAVKNITKHGQNVGRVEQADARIASIASGSANSPADALASECRRTQVVLSDRDYGQASHDADALDTQPVVTANTTSVLKPSELVDNQVSSTVNDLASSETECVEGFQEGGGLSFSGWPDPALCSQGTSGNVAEMEPTPEAVPRRSARQMKPVIRDSLRGTREGMRIQHRQTIPTTTNVANVTPAAQPQEGNADVPHSVVTARSPISLGDASTHNSDVPTMDTTQRTAEHSEISQSSMGEVTGGKRRAPTPPSTSRTAKRKKAGDRTRSNVNISHLRRENELYRVIENMGGIANLHTKELFEAHTSLLNSMAEVGEPTSAPVGTRLDKRTAEAALKSMEERGRIKMLKTSLVSQSGASRPACLLYLPEIPQDKVNEFLRRLSQGTPSASVPPPIKVLEGPVDFGADRHTLQRSTLPLWLLQKEDVSVDEPERRYKDAERVQQLFSYDTSTVRDVLLTERTTLSQLYGFIVGKAVRLRYFHLHSLELFERLSPSPSVVSHQHRIINTSYYHQDIPLGIYCSLIAVTVHDEGLLDLLRSSEGRLMPLKQLPLSIAASLQIGKSRSRSRVLDLVGMLQALGLVEPLERTDISGAQYVCTTPSGDTFAFKKASLEGCSLGTPGVAPEFWRFHNSAPLHLWALSESWPSYWKYVPLNTSSEGSLYWDELHNVSRDQTYARTAVCPSTSMPPPANVSLARCLRRRSSWDNGYVLTWHQKRYLDRYVDVITGQTPLTAETADAQLDQICHTTSAPRQVVIDYFNVSSEKAAHELERAERKSTHAQTDEHSQQNADAKAALQRKVEEAKLQRGQDWDQLLSKIYPEPMKGTLAVRIRAVRNRFMQSTTTKDAQRWEDEIQETIRDAQLGEKKVISKPRMKLLPLTHRSMAAPPPLVANPPEKSIECLIAQQGSPIAQPAKKDKEKAETGEEGKPMRRRARFRWTREFDELARDASAIIRARCRDCVRLDLSAFDQVFPAVPRNSVRQRITHLRECAADDLYMKRLEDQWYTLWIRHRGSSLLPDEDPSSPSNFDLIKHVEFLRKHVDKNALRVGFVEREAVVQLPLSVENLQERYDIGNGDTSGPVWDFMWNTTVEEGREKHFLSQAFTKEPDSVFFAMNDDNVHLAEATSKMVFGTPNELYDPDSAARLLHSAGDQPVSLAISNLLSQGVLSKLVRDPKKPKPGRTLKISDVNLNAIGGPYSRDMFQDAIALEDIAFENTVDEMDWPVLASDGDIVTLIQLVSDDQVDFRIDLTQSKASRSKIDWNSKRADDDDIEITIRLKFMDVSVDTEAFEKQPSETPVMEPNVPSAEDEGHGHTPEGTSAACLLKSSHGLINCIRCIEAGFSVLASGLDEADRKVGQRILEYVRTNEVTGVSKAACLSEFGRERRVLELIEKMATTSPPVLFWTGFTTPVIVASEYGRAWSVVVSEEPLTLVLPRRWLDLRGTKLNDAWTAALRAVVGVVVLRPGITQAELRWRLRAVYDRQEVVEVIMFLEQEGFLEFRFEYGFDSVQLLAGWPATLGDEEERRVFWFLGRFRHWYQLG